MENYTFTKSRIDIVGKTLDMYGNGTGFQDTLRTLGDAMYTLTDDIVKHTTPEQAAELAHLIESVNVCIERFKFRLECTANSLKEEASKYDLPLILTGAT